MNEETALRIAVALEKIAEHLDTISSDTGMSCQYLKEITEYIDAITGDTDDQHARLFIDSRDGSRG